MGALARILSQLDREGASEVVIASGRPVALRVHGKFQNITSATLSLAQMVEIAGDTALSALWPREDGTSAPADIDLGRPVRVQFIKQGADVIVRIAPRVARARVASRGRGKTGSRTAAPRSQRRSTAAPGRVRRAVDRPAPFGSDTSLPLGSRRDRLDATGPLDLGIPDDAPVAIHTHARAAIVRGAVERSRVQIDDRLADAPPRPRDPPDDHDAGELGLDRDPDRRHEMVVAVDSVPVRDPDRRHELAVPASVAVGSVPVARLARGADPVAHIRPRADESDPSRRGDVIPSTIDAPALVVGVRTGAVADDCGAAATVPANVAADRSAIASARPALIAEAPTEVARLAIASAEPALIAEASTVVARPAIANARPALIAEAPSVVTPELARLVDAAVRRAATDLLVGADRPVFARVRGELVALDERPLAPAAAEAMLVPLLGAGQQRQLAERGYVDLAVMAGSRRLRGNVARHQGGLKGAFRVALATPPTLAQLGLPDDLEKLTAHHQGLVVIAGPSGHGKTTTLAALVDRLNATRPIHIIAVEDPVEIEHPRKVAVISQREVGRHTIAFATALKAALRQDPDVIVIGELRDRETVSIALAAAETGHLVMATMSTPSAAKTIDRLIDMFPPDEQNQVRASLAGTLRAIVAQRLAPAIGEGVVPAIELVTGVLPLATLIRENKLYQLPSLLQRGRAFGMLRLDDSLLDLVRAGRLAEEVAAQLAENKRDFTAALHPPAAASQPIKRSGLFGRPKAEE